MLTLNDGRPELWQWDTGRALTVDADCSQVHFSNKVFGRSIDVDVVDGVAIVPDILLQTDKDLNVWAFVGTAENGYTKISKTFKVNRRNKPSDYVFTPPDQTSLEEIKEKIEYLESIQDPDAIKNAVEDYLEQNPPAAYTLPIATETTLGGVKAAAATEEMTQPVCITEDGKLVTAPGQNSGGNVAYDEAQNLTDEQKAQARENIGAQPAGNYLTEVPEGYAKTEDVPTDEEIIQLIKDNAPESSGGGIAVTGAKVGQTVKISAVDENGVPTAWEPVNFPSGSSGGSGGGTKWETLVNEVWQRNREFRFTEYNAETLTYTFPDGTFTDDEVGTDIFTFICIDVNSMPDSWGYTQDNVLTPISGNQATIKAARASYLDGKNYWFEVPTDFSVKGINSKKIRVKWDGKVDKSFGNKYQSRFAYGIPESQSAIHLAYFQHMNARVIADIELELIAPYIVSGKQDAYIFAASNNPNYHKKWYSSYSPVLQDMSSVNNRQYVYSEDGLMFTALYWTSAPWLNETKREKWFIGNGTRIYIAREVDA